MAPNDKGNCPCCDAAADDFVLECEKCKRWIHSACSKLPVYMLIQFHKSTRSYSCLTCVHERFVTDFPALHATFQEVTIKQDKTLRFVTADSSSQTDPPLVESVPIQVNIPPPTQPDHYPPTTDQKDTALDTDHQSKGQQAVDNALPAIPISPPPNSVILGLPKVNSNESRESSQDDNSTNDHEA